MAEEHRQGRGVQGRGEVRRAVKDSPCTRGAPSAQRTSYLDTALRFFIAHLRLLALGTRQRPRVPRRTAHGAQRHQTKQP